MLSICQLLKAFQTPPGPTLWAWCVHVCVYVCVYVPSASLWLNYLTFFCSQTSRQCYIIPLPHTYKSQRQRKTHTYRLWHTHTHSTRLNCLSFPTNLLNFTEKPTPNIVGWQHPSLQPAVWPTWKTMSNHSEAQSSVAQTWISRKYMKNAGKENAWTMRFNKQ